jgi:hypothetical protein
VILSDRKDQYPRTVTHDGKVVFFGIAPDGIMLSYGTNLDGKSSSSDLVQEMRVDSSKAKALKAVERACGVRLPSSSRPARAPGGS